MNFRNKLALILSISSSLMAQNSDDFYKEMMQKFNEEKKQFISYKKNSDQEFTNYYEAQNRVYEDYKKELGVYWKTPKISTTKQWISYTKDNKTRTNVDFSKSTITIETIATSKEDAQQNLKLALATVIIIDNKTVQSTDPLEIKLSKIEKPLGIVDSHITADPILSTVIFEDKPTLHSVSNYVEKHIEKTKITSKKSTKVKHAKIYSLTITLPEDTIQKRSKIYLDDVKKNASIQKLPIALVFAIMQTESSFNPRARSPIPAYGLMQIVPKSAGIDSYQYLYRSKKLVDGRYLYDSKNNIKMGTAYLHILYYRYLKNIKNHDSRLYCTIAAYNTGSGNIAWAFTKTNNMNKAVAYINAKTPKEVYQTLLRDLKYDEPKHYLKKVTTRMSEFYRLYGD